MWPDTTPRRYQLYQPRVYRALGDGKISAPVYEDAAWWEHRGGANSPRAAYRRALDVAKVLNSINADEAAAQRYVADLRWKQHVEAMNSLDKLLNRLESDDTGDR